MTALTRDRTTTLVGMALIADGAAFASNPAAQARIWSSSQAPAWYQRTMAYLNDRPRLCRALAGAELAAGLALLVRAGRAAHASQ